MNLYAIKFAVYGNIFTSIADVISGRYDRGMPDRRNHRGAGPEDGALFAAGRLGTLRRAVRDMRKFKGSEKI